MNGLILSISFVHGLSSFGRHLAEHHKVIDLSHELTFVVIIVSFHFVTLRNEFSSIHFGATK
ncbi:hypothetical protein F0251_13045 [Vibrio sp. 070316B]|uniref:Uncharacterized protein n=1 Tax=Vibrio chagasii TaxID=170679 RepID=A0A7V7TGM8_9VIBR|nr:hypothetical protein F7Q91_10925 [Vibrio chagasii]NOI39363.1 hypothetical protein [Vibrio sp. 070316B]NOI87274.1 hypothetical protein [Vibrio sp. 99K-1]NOI97344.1 hypothetical protein [Vibrio sp. T3Y01]PQJ57416.1 hypothetical protein BTO12_07750 [Vibrio splendidus]